MSWWNSPKVMRCLVLAFGFVAALCGILTWLTSPLFFPGAAITGLLAFLASQRADELDRTAPVIDAFMEKPRPLSVTITVVSENLIPFKYRFFVLNDKGEQVTRDAQFTDSLFHPTNRNRIREETRAIIPAKEMYLVVEFSSLREDLHNLPEQTGTIRKKYRVIPPHGRLKLIDQP